MSRERYSAGDGTVPATRPEVPTGQGLRVSVVAGPDAGTVWTLAQRVVIVGRSARADCRLDDPMVSAFHAELAAEEGGIRVTDLRSRNGTHYGHARLERAVLATGASLEIGSSLVRVDLDAAFADAPEEQPSFGELRGGSAVMRALFSTLERVARTDMALLIEGETGTGKELAARAVHARSKRGAGPFVVLDCTAIPHGLAESVLFGHEKGAFTGAAERRPGVFEAAEGGTVFLDEVGELPLELQPKLLRVLERREIVRVGSTQARAVNARVLSATWRDLRVMINEGRFREDLYYRLAQMRVVMPPLRARLDDVGEIAAAVLERLPADGEGARAIGPDALAELARRAYPGNVRELKNTVERAALLAAGPVVTAADLAFERMLTGAREHPTVAPPTAHPGRASSAPAARGGDAGGDEVTPFKEAKRSLIDEFERDYLQRLLTRTGGNVSRAARLAGVERHYFKALFRKHGLQAGED